MNKPRPSAQISYCKRRTCRAWEQRLGLPTAQFLVACSVQKQRGKTWSFSVYLGRQRGGSKIKELIFAFFQERYLFHFANVWNSSSWNRNYKIRLQACSFNQRPRPPPQPSVYLGRHWCHSRDEMDQAFSLRFAYWSFGRSRSEKRITILVQNNLECRCEMHSFKHGLPLFPPRKTLKSFMWQNGPGFSPSLLHTTVEPLYNRHHWGPTFCPL